MTGLLDLSNELLSSVIFDQPPAMLSSLSLTNQRLHLIANPTLYASIYFWGTGNKDTTERVFESGSYGELYDRQAAPIGAFRVYNLGALTRTLETCPSLASRVKRVELTWGNDKDVEDEKLIMLFLNVIKHIRLDILSLAPPSLYFQVPTDIAVTTLRTRHMGQSGGLDEDVVPDIDQLHKQCCIPSLNEIFVHGWLYWSESMADEIYRRYANTARDTSPRRAKTSPITILRISTIGAPGHVFNDILSWPKKLRVFHFDCEPYIGWGSQFQMPGIFSSRDFINPLEQCCDTLEELSLRGSTDVESSEYLRYVDEQPQILIRVSQRWTRHFYID